MTDEPYETLETPRVRVDVVWDTDPQNPRDWGEHFGTMYCAHRRYPLGDVQVGGEDDLLERLLDVYSDEFPDNPWDEVDKRFYRLPLYLYDHSGITMSTGPFSCPWDSGQVGVIAVAKDKVREAMGWQRLTQARARRVYDILRGEVQEYDAYLTGSVFGLLAFDTRTGDELESCWGFYGRDYALEEAQSWLDIWDRELAHADPDGQLVLQFDEGRQE